MKRIFNRKDNKNKKAERTKKVDVETHDFGNMKVKIEIIQYIDPEAGECK